MAALAIDQQQDLIGCQAAQGRRIGKIGGAIDAKFGRVERGRGELNLLGQIGLTRNLQVSAAKHINGDWTLDIGSRLTARTNNGHGFTGFFGGSCCCLGVGESWN